MASSALCGIGSAVVITASRRSIAIHSRLGPLAIGEESVSEVLDLLDWKRRVFALYAEVRETADPRAAWERWREVRAGLFRDHPQSARPGYERVDYFHDDTAWGFAGEGLRVL